MFKEIAYACRMITARLHDQGNRKATYAERMVDKEILPVPSDLEFRKLELMMVQHPAWDNLNLYYFPDWYIAQDRDGRIHLFQRKPLYHEELGRWFPSSAGSLVFYTTKVPKLLSIHEKPFKENGTHADLGRKSLLGSEINFLRLTNPDEHGNILLKNITKERAEHVLNALFTNYGLNRGGSSKFSHAFRIFKKYLREENAIRPE